MGIFDDDDDWDDDWDDGESQDDPLIQYIRQQAEQETPKWRNIRKRLSEKMLQIDFPSEKLSYLLAASDAANYNKKVFKALEPAMLLLLDELDNADQQVKLALCINDNSGSSQVGSKALDVIQQNYMSCRNSNTKIDSLAALLNDDRVSAMDINDRVMLHDDYYAQWLNMYHQLDSDDQAAKLCDILNPLTCYNKFKQPLLDLSHAHVTTSFDEKTASPKGYTDQMALILMLNRKKYQPEDIIATDIDDECFPDVSSYHWQVLFHTAALKQSVLNGLPDTIEEMAHLMDETDFYDWVADEYDLLDSLSLFKQHRDMVLLPTDALNNFPWPKPGMLDDIQPYQEWASALRASCYDADTATEIHGRNQLHTAYELIRKEFADTNEKDIDQQIAINSFKDDFLYVSVYGLESAIENNPEKGADDKTVINTENGRSSDPDDVYASLRIADYVDLKRRSLYIIENYLLDQKMILEHEREVNQTLTMWNEIDEPLTSKQFSQYFHKLIVRELSPDEADGKRLTAQGYGSPN